MPLGLTCGFCGVGIEPGCEVTIAANADREVADRRSQVVWGHYACLQRATAAVGVLQLEDVCTARAAGLARAPRRCLDDLRGRPETRRVRWVTDGRARRPLSTGSPE